MKIRKITECTRVPVLEILVLARDRYIYVTGLKRLIVSQHSPLDNWIS